MFGFDDESYEMDEAIEQEVVAEDMYGFPGFVFEGQQDPEETLDSCIEDGQ